ncbi:MAG: class I SAM-dependent methyltransferase [Anaerolineaceae bacterium]|nr:class I SAM-dependent methyltransferase [Anaerolineaceae bacterium]
MDVRAYNREAWNKEVEQGNPWTIPVSHEQIQQARIGDWKVVLTPSIPVPENWFPDIKGKPVLCLASGGGQQGPILAAAGGLVTVLDNSPRQLEKDQLVAERESLDLVTVEGDMRDLSMFSDNHFVLIFHPVSNVFVPEIRTVWQEAFRVLQPGGVLLTGFTNPINYIFDWQKIDDEQQLEVKYSLPYSDLKDLPPDQLEKYLQAGNPIEFSHSFDDQIGGQIDAGFVITGFFEDHDPEGLLDQFMPTFFAMRAVKLP